MPGRIREYGIAMLASGASVIALQAGAPSALAQDQDEDTAIDQVTVVGRSSRISSDLSSVPGSVRVLTADEIREQSLFTNDLGEILDQTIPGYGVSSSGSFSNFSQNLRGRKPAVFIDGVPTTVPLRDGGRDVRVISPGAIGQVEVISGSTAVFGLGGAGGLINYATKEPGNGPAEFRTDLSIGMSLTHPDDSFFYTVQQSAAARVDKFSFVFSGFYEGYNSLFDAKGDRIPPDPQNQGGIADTDSYNLFGKIGLDVSDDHRLFASVNYYSSTPKTKFRNGVGEFGSRPAPAVELPPLGIDQKTSNLVTSLRCVADDILGSSVNLQGFYSEYEAIFGFFEPPVFPPDGGQSLISAERYGLRFDVITPLDFGGGNGTLLWGVDYIVDTTSQPMVDGRLLVPEMEQKSFAPFFQLEYRLFDWLNVVGGIRYENADISTGTFTTIAIFDPSLPGGVTVGAGKTSYEEVLFNFGVVVSPFAANGALADVDIYGGFSQGFTVNDFGRALRSTTVSSIAEFEFEAQVIDTFEIGLRRDGEVFSASLAAFQSKSEFGSSFNALTLELLRAPEKVWGLEFALDAEPSEDWNWGVAVAWVDGEVENVTTGVVSPLDTSRISPLKVTAHIEHKISENFAVRGQMLHSGRQQRFDNEQVFGRADVEAFTLIDLSVSGKVGPGTLTLAVNNLLNEFYFTPDAFRFANNTRFTSGTGAMGRLTYTIDY